MRSIRVKKKYYTLVINLLSGRIAWAGRGRNKEALEPFWKELKRSNAKIKAVCCDLSASYWSAIKENLPKADVVFDKFHLVKLMQENLDEIRKQLWREATGLMKRKIKGTRYLLLSKYSDLREDQLPTLQEALDANEPLWKGYLMKEMLDCIWTQNSKEEMENVLNSWCLTAAQSGVRQLQKVAKTFATHASGILAWFDHRISNGRMEGINNKVKTMLRKHYGLRDERFFILRLLSLHEQKFCLTGF